MTGAGLPAATIIVGISQSYCNACVGGCDPLEKKHTFRLPGHSGKRIAKGCGIEFTHITTRSEHLRSTSRVREMRPDLVFVDFPG